MTEREPAKRSGPKWLVPAGALVAGALVAACFATTHSTAKRDEVDLSLCLAGPTDPPEGSRAERVERAAFILMVPREARLTLPGRTVEPPDTSQWPYRCAEPAKRLGHGIAGHLWATDNGASARALVDGLARGFLPKDAAALALVAPTAGTSREPSDLDPLLGDSATATSRAAIRVTLQFPSDRPPVAFEELHVDASADTTCVIGADGGRAFGALRCGPKVGPAKVGANVLDLGGGRALEIRREGAQLTVETTEKGASVSKLVVPGASSAALLLASGLFSMDKTGIWHRPFDGTTLGDPKRLADGASSGHVIPCRHRLGWVLVFERSSYSNEPNPPSHFLPVFVRDGEVTVAPAFDFGSSKAGRLRPTFGPVTVSCTEDEVRVAWAASNIQDVDEHTLRRARCDRAQCELASTEAPDLGFTPTHGGGCATGDPDMIGSPTVIDLGDVAWLVWEDAARLAARSGPFESLGEAKTITLAAQYRPFGNPPPFPSAIPKHRFAVLTRGDVAVVALGEAYDGSRSTFFFRLGADGKAEALVPR